MYINVFNNFICTFVMFISIFLHSNSETIVHLSVSAINQCSLPCTVAESVIPVETCVPGTWGRVQCTCTMMRSSSSKSPLITLLHCNDVTLLHCDVSGLSLI